MRLSDSEAESEGGAEGDDGMAGSTSEAGVLTRVRHQSWRCSRWTCKLLETGLSWSLPGSPREYTLLSTSITAMRSW